MKKKLVFAVFGMDFGMVFVIIVVILLWPLSFANVLVDDTEMQIVIINMGIENGRPIQDSTDYYLPSNSEEFIQIRQLLDKYAYRRSFRSFFSDTLLDGNDAGYWLHLYMGETFFISGGTGEIIINGRIYRIGFQSNEKALEMMDEIRNILER